MCLAEVLTAQPINLLLYHTKHITIYHLFTYAAVHVPLIAIGMHTQLHRRVTERAVNRPALVIRQVKGMLLIVQRIQRLASLAIAALDLSLLRIHLVEIFGGFR